MKILIGICAGIFWALDTVILNLFLEGEDPGIAERLLPFLPLLVTFLHDICSAAYLLFFMAWKKQLKKIKKALFTREGKFVILGALFGGPLGMTGYVLSIRYLGAGNTAMTWFLYGMDYPERKADSRTDNRTVAFHNRNGAYGRDNYRNRTGKISSRDSVCTDLCLWLGERGNHMWVWYEEWCDQ